MVFGFRSLAFAILVGTTPDQTFPKAVLQTLAKHVIASQQTSPEESA